MDPLAEQLASVPQIPRKRMAGDGTEPGGSAGQSKKIQGGVSPDDQPDVEQMPAMGSLEDASDTVAFQTIDQLCKSQDRLRRNRYAIDLYHTWLDNNVQMGFARLNKIPNQSIWVAKLAPGVNAETGAAVPAKANDLCNKVTDALLADPPKPNPRPHVDEESADAAADLASEFLRINAGESGINEVQQYRWALRNALTRASSFLEFDVDQDGGGYQPFQKMAHPQATDPAQPMVAIDPMSGELLPTASPILRYVSPPTPEFPDGQFVENASDADRVWLPKIVCRRHQRVKVVLFPAEATIEEADAAIVTDYCTLADAIGRWPETVGQMTPEQLAGLASWRPWFSDMIVTFPFKGGAADGMTGPAMTDVGTLSPLLQRRMFYHRLYVRKSKEYPNGLTIDISGANGGTRLDQRSMEYTVTLPTAGKTTRCRDIPLTQVTPQQDVTDLDPMGWPFQSRFDGSAQADATIMAEYLDALARMARPHVFIRSVTAVDEDEWYDRTKPIVLNPTDQPPFYEQFPALPPVVAFSEYIQQRQDVASGLTATAQGLDTESSQSGVAKRLTVRQAQISLAGIQQQLHAAITRGWRICCQIAQAYFTTPQMMQYSGEDASNQEQWWTGEDFAGIDEIGIEPGTGTMMTAEDKANYSAFLQQQLWLTPEQAGDIALAGISRNLGLPPDITKAAIERSVGAWLKGPPSPEWVAQWQQYAQAKVLADQQNAAQTAQHQQIVQGATIAGQPAPPAPAPIPAPQKPWTPFPARPNDNEPQVAAKWVKRLSLLQMTPQYEAMPAEWRQCADEKYLAARQAVALASAAQQPQPQGQPSPAHLPESASPKPQGLGVAA
jgi:hypothetical protein